MNRTKSFHIQTFGCQMNERDSETLAGMLEEMGFKEEPERDASDVVIINTCSVREHADERFFGTLGQLKKIKESRPEFIVGVCGCMMQQQHIIDRIKSKYPWVDIIFGTYNIHEFPKLLKAVAQEKEKMIDVWPEGGDIVECLPSKRKYKFKAFVNIMFGCNNFCTYCIVPFTRGRERSRDPENVTDEVRTLVADGVREITLLGQNVNSYKGGDVSFPGLLYMLADIDGLERIRFMTSHPKDLSPELISAFRDIDKLESHIHLPVQSGSDSVLRRMNRHYDREKYIGLVKDLRAARPGIAISTDIIVGFPGETEEDFEDTLSLCREVEYDSAFTFIYSVRQGTPAAKFEDQIPEDIKHERFSRLVDVVNHSAAAKNAAMVGETRRVLVEGPASRGEGMMSGRTSEFKLVDFEGAPDLTGEMIDVVITEGRTFSLKGRIL